MVKFKKEKVLFFKKEVKTLCSCERGGDNPWRMPPPSPPPHPNPPPPRPF